MAKFRARIPRYQREAKVIAKEKQRLLKEKGLPSPATGRIAAKLAEQAPNNSYAPKLFYEDREFTCRDCGKREFWTARQQQWWYEIAKGPIYSTAVRCRACRKARRSRQLDASPAIDEGKSRD